MKQLIAVIIVLVVLLGCVAGYLLLDMDQTITAFQDLFAPTSASEADSVEPETETKSSSSPPDATPPEATTDATTEAELTYDIGEEKYIHHQLDETKQGLYRRIHSALTGMAPNVILSLEEQRSFQSEDILNVFNYVLDDSPELFWADHGITISTIQTGGVVLPTEVRFTYLFDAEERTAIQRRIDDYEALCLQGLAPDASVFDKILHVYEYIIDTTEYDLESQYNQNMISVALYGKSVCKGYARMTQYLLGRLGIPCTTVNGYAGEPHSWNLVNADGVYYYLDTTWGDPQKLDLENPGTQDSGIGYQYFLITDEELALTHRIEERYPLPPCNATELNYYTYTGRLFDAYDRDDIASVLLEDFGSGKNISTIRFTDEAAFQTARSTLVDQFDAHAILAEIEAYQRNGYAYSYSYDDDFLILNFII